ncbi:response regulator [Sulfurovum sp. ST-21]|uniref:Response regulator n=1 Tax=Sulfurovum indicum TaxID=2779528 RepID=A0A7M1S6Q5_9BACT|nr:response regulator [Sulfurovum indicum]QOR62379.1 response regulator [Sulfurovum indicum]
MGLKVLVVDDDMINRMLLKTLLKKNTKVTEIIEAENGSDALNKMKQEQGIDIILLDIMMPIVDGIEFLKIFRADMANAHIPVIVLSTDDTRKTEVFDNGANDFIRKPVKEEALFVKIDQWSD